MSDPELYRALLAERYGPSLWWKKPEPPKRTEGDGFKRLRDLVDEADTVAERGAA